MRSCSANEVFHIARKACVGAGLAHDRAEDLAEAATMLQCSGAAGLAAVHRLLVRHQQSNTGSALGLKLGAGEEIQVARLRPEAEGVAVIDWLIAGNGRCEADIQMGYDPVMMAGLLAVAAQRYGGRFWLRTPDQPTPLFLSGPPDISGLPVCAGWRLGYQADACDEAGAQVNYNHTEVEISVWEALAGLAHLTYVPASETSRQSGAGAGLVDND